MLSAAVILTLAWAIAGVNESLGTATYLTELLVEDVNPHLLPALVFLLAFAIAFATGTSWGVMAILIPLVVPLTAAALEVVSLPDVTAQAIFYAAIASTLTGAVWGDHCSPISDTTILSSIASGCEHISHVRTQLPYAMLVGAVSLMVGLLPAGFGLPWWGGLLAGIAVLWAVLRVFGSEIKAQF
jgi:Na+/H+ antiporter NhaC